MFLDSKRRKNWDVKTYRVRDRLDNVSTSFKKGLRKFALQLCKFRWHYCKTNLGFLHRIVVQDRLCNYLRIFGAFAQIHRVLQNCSTATNYLFLIPKGITGSSATILQYSMNLRKGQKILNCTA